MEENLTPVIQNPVQPTPPSIPLVQTPKGKKPLVLLIAVHIIAISVISYFIYQYIQLKKQISLPQTIPLVSNIPTLGPTSNTNFEEVNIKGEIIKNDKTNLNTYINKTLGFSFTYPDTYIVDELNASYNNKSLSVVIHKADIDKTLSYCPITNLTFNINTEGSCGSLAYKGTTTKILESDYTIGGIPVKKYDDYFGENLVESRINFSNSNKDEYYFIYFIHPDDYSNIVEITSSFNQILSTFKFTQ